MPALALASVIPLLVGLGVMLGVLVLMLGLVGSGSPDFCALWYGLEHDNEHD